MSIYRHGGSGTDENPCVRLFLFFEKICLCPFRCLSCMQNYPQNVLCPFRCLYIDMPFLGKMRLWPKISRKIDALTGVSLPQLRLRFVGKICYANQKMRCYASQRIQRATHVRILNSFVAICEVKSQYKIPLLWRGSWVHMKIVTLQTMMSLSRKLATKLLEFCEAGLAKRQFVYGEILVIDFVMWVEKFWGRCAMYFDQKVGV